MRLKQQQIEVGCRASRQWGRATFNIVELVVVVTAVVALFSLLLPVLYQGRLFAKQSACKENLKNLGSWTLLYSYNNESLMPAYEDDWLKTVAEAGAQSIDQHSEPQGAFACPSQEFVSYSDSVDAANYWRGSHYGINQHIASNLKAPNGDPLPQWTRADLRKIEDPERKVLIGDSSGGNYFGIVSRDPTIAGISMNGWTYADGLLPKPASPLPAMRHLTGTVNVVWLDGRVEVLSKWPPFMLGTGTPGYVFWHGEHWYPESGRERPDGGATANR